MADTDLAPADAASAPNGLAWAQDERLIAIDTPLGKDTLLLTSLVGEEAISRLFNYEIGMVSTNHALHPEAMIGQPVAIRIRPDKQNARWIHGRVATFRAGGMVAHGLRYYSAEVVPWLWYLTLTTDCRIYQNLSVPDIVKQVFQTYGFSDFKMALSAGDYPTLEYCVQYRESAFNFVSRLMEHEGIFYFFQHSEDKHTLVIGDKNINFQGVPDLKLVYGEEVSNQAHVTQWDHVYAFKPGRWAQTDYNFETPTTSLLTTEKSLLKLSSADQIERFDFPGDYMVKDAGSRRTRMRMEAEEAAHHVVRGSSSNAFLAVGGKFTLQRHSCEDPQQRYVIRSVRHEASDMSYIARQGAGLTLPNVADEARYENTFEAMPDQVLFRPQQTTEKPVVHGPQTATVVGPAGEKIFTDKHSRVRVQFHWDRYGKNDDQSSCWIRVSQGWAGRGWGNLNLPHVGHEVVVSFLEGDPDRPLVTGRVYNGDNMNAVGLPDNKTQSAIRDHSGNEIVMEGKSGSQDIRTHAVKDMHVTVDNDRDDHVKNDLSYTVDGTSTEVIKKKTSITITEGDYSHTVSTGTATITVKGKVTETFQDAQATTVTQSITVTSQSSSVHVKAATDIVLEVGKSKLSMYSDGRIELSGKAVAIKGTDAVNTSGMSIKSDAGKDHSITGSIVLSSGSVSNTVKGAMVMLNP